MLPFLGDDEHDSGYPWSVSIRNCGQAVEAGAAAVMLPFPLGDELDLGVPVVVAEDVWEATHEAACDLYDDPSTRMFTVGIAGGPPCLCVLLSCALSGGCCCRPSASLKVRQICQSTQGLGGT